MKRILPVLLLLFLTNCAAVLDALAVAAQVGQYAAVVGEMADGASERYFAAHPNPSREADVASSLQAYRKAVAAYDALVAAGQEPDRATILLAYTRLWDLLNELGVIDGIEPSGGAEGLYPHPGPADLPTPEEFGRRW